MKHWAEDLNLQGNFDLINDEKLFGKNEFDADSILSKIENDPFDLDNESEKKANEFEKFIESQENIGTNMAVVIYMVAAIQYLRSKSRDEIKQVATEVVMQGAHGYDPKKEGYRLNTIPGKVFTGYQIMAYFYVSWAMTMPEMLPQLNLPYDKEYEMALKMVDEG